MSRLNIALPFITLVAVMLMMVAAAVAQAGDMPETAEGQALGQLQERGLEMAAVWRARL